MKKFSIALIIALMGCGFAACSDDNDSSSDKKADGAGCTAAAECKSGFCSEEGKCAPKPAEKKDDGAECGKADECKSNFCSEEGKCAPKPAEKKDDGAECGKADECKSNFCINAHCTTPNPGDPCDADMKTVCVNNALYSCELDMSTGDSAISVADCGSKTCVSDGDIHACLAPCEKENETSFACDVEGATDGDTILDQQTFTCQKIGDKLFNVVTDTITCTNGTMCDPVIGKCDEPGIREEGIACSNSAQCVEGLFCQKDAEYNGKCAKLLGDGEKCAEDGDCTAKYCKKADVLDKEGVCTAKAAVGTDCNINRDCASDYCKKADPEAAAGKCTDKVDAGNRCDVDEDCTGSLNCNDVTKVCGSFYTNDAACTKNEDCKSNYCNGSVCANAPLADGKKCSSSSECESGFCNPDGVCATPQSKRCSKLADCADEAGTVCGPEFTCIKDTKKGYGEACNAENDCVTGLICLKNKCKLADEEEIECQSEGSSCTGNVLHECVEWGGLQDVSPTVCSKPDGNGVSKECVTVGRITDCMEECFTEGGNCQKAKNGKFYIVPEQN